MSTRYTNVYWQRVCTISIRCRRSRSSTRGTSSAWRGERGEGAAPRPRRGWGWGSWGTLAAGRQPLCYSASPSEKLEDVCAESPGPVGGGGGGSLRGLPCFRPPSPLGGWGEWGSLCARPPSPRAHRGASTSLCSRQAIMISDRMTTPVRPTPALQWTSSGGFGLWGSLVLFVWRRTDWISSRYAVKRGRHRQTQRG